MTVEESIMRELGSEAPPFELPDPRNSRIVRLDQAWGVAGLLIMFICNHCPYVHHVREELVDIGRQYGGQDLGIIAINSNDIQRYPEDDPKEMAANAQWYGYPFPYLWDETQEVAKAFGAACTPDFFLFDATRRLVYRGQLDDSRPGNGIPVTGRDLRAALDAVLADQPVPTRQLPSAGCNIKWKPGNEPDDVARDGS
jgi:peroxiredoxin